jgi:hypothetical protein
MILAKQKSCAVEEPAFLFVHTETGGCGDEIDFISLTWEDQLLFSAAAGRDGIGRTGE